MSDIVFPLNASRTNWNQVEDVYTIWTDLGDADRPCSYGSEELKLCVKLVQEKHEWIRNCPNGKLNTVHKWLTDPKRFSPWVDDLNVLRATQLHRSAWEAMTAREYVEITQKLSRMTDPFENDVNKENLAKGASAAPRSARIVRWQEDFSVEERTRIISAVCKLRSLRFQRGKK